jgi:hypothetical protein
MAIIEKQRQNSSPNDIGEDFSLSKSELEFLLLLIKDSTFKGIQVEDVYNTVYKLQKQYTNIK